MFSLQINRLRLMGLNGCEILFIIMLHKQSGLEIEELAFAFAKLGSRHIKLATEEMKKLGNVIIERPFIEKKFIERPFIEKQFIERPFIDREEKFRKHQQKLAVRHFKRK